MTHTMSEPISPDEVAEPKTTEPVALSGAAVVLVNSAIALLIGFGIVDWTVEQIGLVVGFANNTIIILGVLFARSRVTPIHDPRDNGGNPMEVLPQYLQG